MLLMSSIATSNWSPTVTPRMTASQRFFWYFGAPFGSGLGWRRWTTFPDLAFLSDTFTWFTFLELPPTTKISATVAGPPPWGMAGTEGWRAPWFAAWAGAGTGDRSGATPTMDATTTMVTIIMQYFFTELSFSGVTRYINGGAMPPNRRSELTGLRQGCHNDIAKRRETVPDIEADTAALRQGDWLQREHGRPGPVVTFALDHRAGLLTVSFAGKRSGLVAVEEHGKRCGCHRHLEPVPRLYLPLKSLAWGKRRPARKVQDPVAGAQAPVGMAVMGAQGHNIL